MCDIVSIDQTTAEILILKAQTAQNIVEIGKRLIAVKQTLAHGEWYPYLSEKVGFSARTAQRFMNLAREYPPALADLNSTKIISLLELPVDLRDDFIATPQLLSSGETKLVSDMTTRELNEAITAKNVAEYNSAQLNNLVTIQHRRIEELQRMQPEKITKIIETKPLDYYILKTKATETDKLAQQLYALDRDSQAKIAELIGQSPEERREFQLKAEQFCRKIENFLSDMSFFGYLGEQFFKDSYVNQRNSRESLAKLEQWVQDATASLNKASNNLFVAQL
ncbi:MAG: DUF3102 domain-containing protein [Negativicutes bacterium]|jgi:hypothetical protein